MKQYNVLIFTDHTNHSKENSLYDLARVMQRHQLTAKIDVATRGNIINKDFFDQKTKAQLKVSRINEAFSFTENAVHFTSNLVTANLETYDLIWLRMPPPLTASFLNFISNVFSNQLIINDPKGIHISGSKEFLINFKSVCPPIKLCNSKADIINFKNKFPIVLKPFREYGGKGIVKIDGNKVWLGKKEMSFDTFINSLNDNDVQYLAVKFLKNVTEGDKRIVVVNGKIMGASLRLPPKDSWICNVAMGGSSNIAAVEEEEIKIVETINPILSKMGIVMYGVDTLVDDNGKRILSEINTTSIGGLPQIAKLKNQALVEEAIDLIWKYFLKNK